MKSFIVTLGAVAALCVVFVMFVPAAGCPPTGDSRQSYLQFEQTASDEIIGRLQNYKDGRTGLCFDVGLNRLTIAAFMSAPCTEDAAVIDDETVVLHYTKNPGTDRCYANLFGTRMLKSGHHIAYVDCQAVPDDLLRVAGPVDSRE